MVHTMYNSIFIAWSRQMRGVVLVDEGSGPVRCEEWSGRWEEWSWQMRGVVRADEGSGPGR